MSRSRQRHVSPSSPANLKADSERLPIPNPASESVNVQTTPFGVRLSKRLGEMDVKEAMEVSAGAMGSAALGLALALLETL